MSKNNLNELIQIIEEKASIEDVISDYIHLEKRGANYWAICPFHQDTNPSMSVSPQKKIFKCFTCGAGGGIISFVQNYEGISFIDSLKKISSKYDIDYKQFITDKKQIIDHKKDKIIEINYTAQEFFKFTLESMLNNFEHPVVKYLAERNLTHEDIDTFNIGYAPKDDSLINFLVGKGFTEAEIVNAGLAREVDYKIRNYFFDRIIFPIEDANGRVVGFSGRTTTGSGPKYLNSPETRAFKKTEILYNFNKARSPASLKKFLVVVEGFMDSIALHKAGVKNVVATMGTAFSETHQKNIKSIAKNIILLFDNDKAGFKTTIDVGSKLLTQGFVIKVLVPEGSKDVDEFIEKNGEKALLALFSKTYEFLNYYFDSILSNMTDDSIDYEKIREYLSLVSKETDSMKREAETNKLLNKFPNLDQEQIKSHVNALSKIKVTDVPRQVIEKPRKSRKNQEKIQIIDQRILKNEIKILWSIIQSKESLDLLTKKSFFFKALSHKNIHSMIVGMYDSGIQPTFENLESKTDDENILNRLAMVKEFSTRVSAEKLAEFVKLNIMDIQLLERSRSLLKIKERLAEASTTNQKNNILKQI